MHYRSTSLVKRRGSHQRYLWKRHEAKGNETNNSNSKNTDKEQQQETVIHCVVVVVDFFDGLCFIYETFVDSGHFAYQNSQKNISKP